MVDIAYSGASACIVFVNPRPPIRTGNAKRSLSVYVHSYSMIDGVRASATARSNGSSRSSMSGSVLRKYVHRCLKPRVKAA